MKQNDYFLFSSVIFSLVTILHALRVFYSWEAMIGDWMVPMWVSWAAVIIAGYLAYNGYMFRK